MTKIQPIELGLPKKIATQIHVHTLPISVKDTTCGIYYQLSTELGEPLADGNLFLNEEKFIAWGDSMDYITDFTLTELGLTKVNI